MNSISVLYIKTSSHTEEKISVGLFACGLNKKYFSYSKEKIKIANSIIESNLIPLIGSTLQNIEREINIFNKSPLKFNEFGLNESSFNYLSTYSKGILNFEVLKPISIDITDETFDQLFKLLIDSSPEKNNVISFSKRFSNKLKHKAFDKIDRKFEITTEILGTYAAHKVDFIGKNGSLLVGTAMDFNSRPETVDRGILEFKAITNSLMSFSNKNKLPKGTFNIYCNEPESLEGKKFFDKVYADKNKTFSLLTLEKIDDVISQIENGNYIKFSEYLGSLK